MNNRTIRKGAVELAAALAITTISWGVDSAAELGASPALLALIIPAALTLRRMIRDRFLGGAPAAEGGQDPPALAGGDPSGGN